MPYRHDLFRAGGLYGPAERGGRRSGPPPLRHRAL